MKSLICFDSWTDIRDDLEFILEEDLTNINLCALHMENRNTEQFLRSLGLLAHEINSLKECNVSLKQFGPKNFTKDRIKIKPGPDQQTGITRSNIKIASMSGMYLVPLQS